MKKHLILFILFSFVGIYLNAQDVYVNNFTNKYHTKDCPKIDSKYFEIYLGDAINSDYTACKVCKPPTKVQSNNVDTSINNHSSLLYTEVVRVDSNISKNILFERARAWLNDRFTNYKEVSQIQDKESGELSIKGILFTHYLKNFFGSPLSNEPCNVRFKLSIWVKGGRYKYEFTDFIDECTGPSGVFGSLGILTYRNVYKEKGNGKNILNDLWVEVKHKTEIETKEMISSLKVEMSKSKMDKDEW